MKSKYLLLPLLFILSSCSSKSGNSVIYHNDFAFNQVSSYSIYQRDSAFTDTQSLSDAHRNSIEIAIEKSMDALRFNYADTDQADVIVTYHILSGKKADYTRYNKAVLFCPQCIRAEAWNKSSQPLKLTRGGLIIDLIDPKKKRSVWRSAHTLKINVKDNSQIVHEKIQQAVQTMLSHYPNKPSYHNKTP